MKKNINSYANYNKMHNRKSQGLPMNVIIIAAIVLIALIVIIAVFTGRFGIFSKNMKSCEMNGGNCVKPGECENAPVDFECPEGKEKKVCCITSGGII